MSVNFLDVLKHRIRRTPDFMELRDKTNIPVFLYDDFVYNKDYLYPRDIKSLGKAVTVANNLVYRKRYMEQMKINGTFKTMSMKGVHVSPFQYEEGCVEGYVYLLNYKAIVYLDEWYMNREVFERKEINVYLEDQESPFRTKSNIRLKVYYYEVKTSQISNLSFNMNENYYPSPNVQGGRRYFSSKTY